MIFLMCRCEYSGHPSHAQFFVIKFFYTILAKRFRKMFGQFCEGHPVSHGGYFALITPLFAQVRLKNYYVL